MHTKRFNEYLGVGNSIKNGQSFVGNLTPHCIAEESKVLTLCMRGKYFLHLLIRFLLNSDCYVFLVQKFL